ncbi:sugar phosphate isomerase/epimerase [Paenibacillus glycanilyticus]|uniref:sugar phosphate isomerase/epimerase family protein n=1 Tax=Paenibacillus glycanilyticus TaxID=126569 RepID=UPI00204134FD|nr:sugar phosphate isomerase/epimerase family protein [Paenibacillus glycanilyticus]MCM3630435.1 sugar phosphate isomerase/epimerase [Paenibacillus glycanilyticus]
MKFGVSTYSYYQALQSGEMDVLDVIATIAAIGGEHVEIVPLGFNLTDNPGLIEDIRRKADEVGIDISNYLIGANFADKSEEEYEQEIERVKREVDIAAKLGVGLMRHDVASSPDTSIGHFNNELPKLAEACRRITDYAATKGIITTVENHGYFLQASDRVQALIHATDRGNFRTTVDVGNFLCVDEDSAAGVSNNIAYASMVHIKDFYVRHPESKLGEGWFRSSHGNYLRGAIVGHGDIDMRRVLGIVKQSGYDGYISVEFEGLEPCRFAVQQGLNQLRTIWGTL